MPNDQYKDWIRKAEGDFKTAVRESKVTKQPNYDGICCCNDF